MYHFNVVGCHAGKFTRSQEYTKYQWPANQITPSDMAILHKWREKTETPINHLLAQAIRELDKIINRKEL